MTNTVDLIRALNTHLDEFELPAMASVRASAYTSQLTVQLPASAPSSIAAGLLAWADTLTDITAEAWRDPHGDSMHLSVTGLLPDGTTVEIYGALPINDHGPGADLAPGATTTVTLATLRHLATPGHATEEDAL
ncbi:MAG TPA: hypothetical protein VN748_17265 [Pseudonocardiaceae bacterium]|nr:hypothetical protein [Pseudonocardiaceae bacterium]